MPENVPESFVKTVRKRRNYCGSVDFGKGREGHMKSPFKFVVKRQIWLTLVTLKIYLVLTSLRVKSQVN